MLEHVADEQRAHALTDLCSLLMCRYLCIVGMHMSPGMAETVYWSMEIVNDMDPTNTDLGTALVL